MTDTGVVLLTLMLLLVQWGCELSGHLKGVRSSAEGVPSTGQTQEFAHRYGATVREQRSTTAKVLLTPVTVAADGALMLGGLFLLFSIFAGYG